MPTEIFVPKSEKTRLEILREHADYQPGGEKIGESSYELCAKAPDILKKYDFDSYFEGISPDSDEIAFAVLAFVCDHFGHDGCSGLGKSRTIEGQIRFCEEHNGKANCSGLAILLAALLRLKGIKARHITCMPYRHFLRAILTKERQRKRCLFFRSTTRNAMQRKHIEIFLIN